MERYDHPFNTTQGSGMVAKRGVLESRRSVQDDIVHLPICALTSALIGGYLKSVKPYALCHESVEVLV